mgnify:CR=1 FL=1
MRGSEALPAVVTLRGVKDVDEASLDGRDPRHVADMWLFQHPASQIGQTFFVSFCMWFVAWHLAQILPCNSPEMCLNSEWTSTTFAISTQVRHEQGI